MIKNPVVIVGSQVRTEKAEKAAKCVVEAFGCRTVVTSDGKGLFPEDHPAFAGVYMGQVGIPMECREVVGTCDACIVIGAVFSDYSTTGFKMDLKWQNTVQVNLFLLF
ncbi:hypothetical protein CBR_g18938 [Chara braunii]|uniref:Thiamine pyrophosphate enzyme central domain-containing protein n=1 Tax=Chara braunii TaxID=69332 RepID=A0A388KWZ2_CHABU|nr:hypothetical protein CBR_g18938 [Chara braunii]|eukprot:GBG74528.1 hypothetical protein CBR_g18938 [Chara braunii]